MAITGMGVISCVGRDVGTFAESIRRGRDGFVPIGDPRLAHLKAQQAGLVREFETDSLLPGYDRSVQLALAAAREALAAAAVRPEAFGRRMGLVFGTCSGPMLLIERGYERRARGEPPGPPEEEFAREYYAGAKVLAHALGIRGISTTVVTACSASTTAIALGTDLIRLGLLDVVLAGGADAFAPGTVAGFDALKATAAGKCAPFSKPTGLTLGEGAGFLVLEALDTAGERGAVAHAEIAGTGLGNDAYHCTSPDPTGAGLASVMRRALADAGLGPEDIAYVNAHGTGTEANDKAETKALVRVLGDRARQVPVSSTKSMVGHCLGAAGALETIASLVCARAGVYPPTAGFTEPREGCTLDYVPDAGRPWRAGGVFMTNNSAFGGHNASLVIALGGRRPPDAGRAEDSVVITGCGLVSPLGLGVAAFLDGLQQGRAGTTVDDDATQQFDRRLNLRALDPGSRWATVAAQMALHDAGLARRAAAQGDVGIFLHVNGGPAWAEAEWLRSMYATGFHQEQLGAFPYIVPCSVTGNVCRELRLSGHNATLCAGPGGSLTALALAACAIRNGHAPALLSGAVDVRTGAAGAAAAGEGAAMLLVETGSQARARGARPLAVVCGMAFATELDHVRTGDANAGTLEAVVREALDRAGLVPEQVSRICQAVPAGRRRWGSGLCAAWAARVTDVSPRTGTLAGAQPLLDLIAALRGDATPGHLLAVASSPGGADCALILKIVDRHG